MADESTICPDCDMALPPGAPAGFCPRCLMGTETLGRTAGGRGDFDPPSAEALDATLKDIEITELLGRGGMGAVYKGRQSRLDRTVAVKVLPAIDDDDERAAFDERFEREAQTMARLNHPNIVGVHDFGETDQGLLYIVMECVEGTDLATLIRGGELDSQHALKWVPQMCDALAYAHANGVVHRDIKPSNVLVLADGSGIKIADFGIARLAGEELSAQRMTMTDIAVGTPDYVAPEQMEGGSKVDHRADIYSLGVVMYEMLTGRVPRGAWKPPSESKRGESVAKQFDPIVHRAMQAEPDERYQQASEVRTDIHEIGGETSWGAGSGVGKNANVRWRWAAASLGLAATVAAVAIANRPAGSTADPKEAPAPTAPATESTTLYRVPPPPIDMSTAHLVALPDDPTRPVISYSSMRTERPSYAGDERWFNGPPPHGDGAAYHYRVMAGGHFLTRSDEEEYVFGGRSLGFDAGSTLELVADDGGKGGALRC